MKNQTWKITLFLLMIFTSFCLWSEVTIQSSYQIPSKWDSGYIMNVDVQNNSNKILKGWKVNFTLPSSQIVVNLWNGKHTVSGSNITVQNESWNGALQPGQKVSFGLQVSGPGVPSVTNLKATGDDGGSSVPVKIPGIPVLNPVNNSDFDGNYTVSWSIAENATSYVLEESKDVNFTSFSEVYNGSDTHKDFSSKSNGNYYYRVKGKNTSQTGNASNVVEAIVNVTNPIPSTHKIIGYFPNWAMYRAKPFYAKDINPGVVTHINYAFAPVDVDGTIRLFDPWSDTDFNAGNTGDRPYSGNFYQLYQLKKQKPGLKTLISLGGWTLSSPFSQMASTPGSRDKFAQNCVDFCKKYDFDGIDIDWEYPGFADHSGRPEDTVNFTLLLKTVSEKLKAQNPPLLLTIAAPAGPGHYLNIEVSKIHQYLDWINIMGYDFHGPWGGSEDSVTNHLASIKQTEFGDPLFNIDTVLDYYISQGVPEEKIVLGLPLYGRSYADVDDNQTGLYSTYSGPGHATTEEVGYVFYSDIQNNLLKSYKAYWDSKALGAYIYNESTKDFISYDNEQSWTLKAQVIKDRGLGGAMVWELGMDTMPDWKMMTLLNNELKK